jgi:hypothetical protein
MPRSRARTLLRWLGILLVLGLGAMAVALVVLGDSQKQLRIGVLLGIWAAVVAYFLPSRREEQPQAVATGHDPSRVYNDVGIRTAPDPRREFREYQAQLERTFRRDMDQALGEHLARLRGEVALLRNDLVEQVNGQLRLERTETTRALGSDIEGLQQEIRRLAASREYLTSVPTLTATRETVTVAAAPGDASGAGQRSVPRVVSSPPAAPLPVMPALEMPPLAPPPVSLPPIGSIPVPPGGAMASPPPRAASPLAPPSVTPRPATPPLATSRPVMPPSAMSRPGMPSSATQRPATPPPAPPRPAASPLASAIPPARAAAPLSPFAPPPTDMPPTRSAGSAISPPPFTPPPPAPPQRVQPAPYPTRAATPVQPANGTGLAGFSNDLGAMRPQPPASASGWGAPSPSSLPSAAAPLPPSTPWSTARPAGNGVPAPEPYAPPDPFGEMPRIGVFRDMNDNDIVPALPDGYVGRRRRPSAPAHSGAPANGMSGLI